MTSARSVKRHIFFLDDEPQVRHAVKETLDGSDIEVECFDAPAECLASLRSKKCDLLITDLRMPGKDGLQLLTEVKQIVPWVPVLVITGYGDIPTAVKAIKGGAVDFMEKPLAKKSFVRKIKSILRRGTPENIRLGKPLTRAEASVLRLIIKGRSNKQIAGLLNRSIRTIEVHRAHLMQKLGVDNVIDLVKWGAAVGLIDLEPERPDEEKDEIEHEDKEKNKDQTRSKPKEEK
jgi:FixJ family two-component response regulator